MALTLERLLQSQGFGTRRACRKLIFNGEVTFDGVQILEPASTVEAHGKTFRVAGETWAYRERVYLALNKPEGYECSRKPSHHPGILSLFPDPLRERNVQAVGRLDHDTTGLLLLSDDGAFIHRMTSPRHHVNKVYHARTQEPCTAELLSALRSGVLLHDETVPCKVESCRLLDDYHIEIVLDEGKYHQVKRMLAAAGNHCLALERVAIGPLTLARLGLGPGEWCYIEPSDLAAS